MTLLLALDIATNTGWACGNPLAHRVADGPLDIASGGEWPKPNSGVRRACAAGASLGPALSGYAKMWGQVLERDRPTWVAYEAPIMGGKAANQGTVRLLNGMIGTIARMCFDMGIPPPIENSNASIKKHWTGSGAAKKPDMVAAARARGWPVTDHNEADALALFDLVAARIQRGEWKR
jgi:hypothetical protein